MSTFAGVFQHEYRLSIRRPGFWVAYILLSLFYLVALMWPTMDKADDIIAASQVWPEAGHTVFMYNLFMPLLAGILAADRMQRDFRTGVRELQRSTPLSQAQYLLAKYFGVLASVLTPFVLLTAISGALLVGLGFAPAAYLWPLTLAFFIIAVPAHAFVVAFSLVCPLVLPLRVYQVLFTGYWFWGNMLSPKAFPTISDTVLNAVGQYPLQAYFDVFMDSTYKVTDPFTPLQANLNLLTLMGCIIIILAAGNWYIRRQEQTA